MEGREQEKFESKTFGRKCQVTSLIPTTLIYIDFESIKERKPH